MQQTLQPERVGEVVICGAAVTSGYWGDPHATSGAINNEGWLQTGDLGWFDIKGRLMLCGRRKDMIKSGGENVHASEVESALAVVTGVQEAAVVGIPHVRFGETVAALLCVQFRQQASVATQHPFPQRLNSNARGKAATGNWGGVLRGLLGSGGSGSSQEVVLLHGETLAWLQVTLKRGGLSGFKVPTLVAVSQLPLPRTATGKVDKRTVKSMLHKLSAPHENVNSGGIWHRSAL